MVKVSPFIRSFNGGEVSPLVEGRTDIDRYPSSSRKMLNVVAAPQGPAIPRSGTTLMGSTYSDEKKSLLVPFIFSETDFYNVEFTEGRIRFYTENGILTYAPVVMTINSASPFRIDSPTLNADIGDQVALSNFPANYNLNGEVATITAKVGTVYTLDIPFPGVGSTGYALGKVARVYHITSPYTEAQLADVFDLASLDVVYLFHPKVKTLKLQRNDTYNWTLNVVNWVDGPYLPTNLTSTKLTPATTGRLSPDMTGAAAPAGYSVNANGSETVGHEGWLAFDAPSNDTYFQSNDYQRMVLVYKFPADVVLDGYSIQYGINNANTSYTSKDFAPSTWTLEGSHNGAVWETLDKQTDYVLYTGSKSVLFKLNNTTPYNWYRFKVMAAVRNGQLKPTLQNFMMRGPSSAAIVITASSTTGINNGKGFLSTDVGRLLRMKGSDNRWRAFVITAVANTTSITATLQGEPFINLQSITDWRLGLWSDTTGYPNCGTFNDDRLWAGGSDVAPDQFAYSQTGLYENMSPTTEDGTVLDTNGYSARLNARRLSRIKWMTVAKDGVAMGTGSYEYIVGTTDNSGKTIVPSNTRARKTSSRGSYKTPALEIDQQSIFIQRSGRTVREYAYTYESDSYKSPSMSQLASHLGISPFVRMAFAAEPYSIVWMLRADGQLVGMTYNRDENVVGWHRHIFPDIDAEGNEVPAFIESISVLPSSDQMQDVLWMVVRRLVGGVTRRYIEKLTKFWDFDSTIDTATYVDSALRYQGVATDKIYGLQHLEDREVYGLADGIPVGPLLVEGGSVELQFPASNVVLGIGFDSEGATSRLENGAQDGTAIGKTKRINYISVLVWNSYGGEVGVWNEDTQQIQYTDLADRYPINDISEVETITLFSGIVGPIEAAPNYEKDGSVYFRRNRDKPLPFNLVAIMPQMNTQDRG